MRGELRFVARTLLLVVLTGVIVPGNRAESAILTLVNGECVFNGAPFLMPAECAQAPCLPAEQITIIRNWILSGALGPP
jgi:hypothetical protein